MNKQKLIELRCKAWGITEIEYYCNQCSDFSLEDMARAYRRGKNKGASDIAIQNGRFYQKQMQDIYDKKNKQIAELENKLANADYQLEGRDNEIRELNEKIEKMKCGGNCKHLYHVNTGDCYDAKCDLTYCDCTNCKDEWELRR